MLCCLLGCAVEDDRGTSVATANLADATAHAGLPDIVLITVDTTRADHLGTYGYFRDTSPRIDELAEESLVFEKLIVPMATTLPSHTSLFTGVQPEEHGILANVKHGRRRFVPSKNLETFASYADRIGLRTAAFISASTIKRGTGLEEGFDIYDEPDRPERPADETTDRALAWLRDAKDAPFFLWVHYFDPHAPFEPPPGFRDRYRSDEALEAFLAQRRIPEFLMKKSGEDEPVLELMNLYDGEIRFMDHQIGRLLDALRARSRWPSTLLVLAGDHGEALGQHRLLGHGQIWGEQLHAPLLIRVPGVEPRRIPSLTSSVDVFPTLLALADLPDEDRWMGQVSGRNAVEEASRRPVVSRTSLRQNELGRPSSHALTTERWKYVTSEDGSEELYDLEADPFELVSVGDAHPVVLSDLRETLREALALQRERGRGLQSQEDAPMDPARLRELEALGYIETELDTEPEAEPSPSPSP